MNLFKSVLFLFFFFITVNFSAQGQNNECLLLIGTYSSQGAPNGIHVYRFDTVSGNFQVAQPVTELSNASFLTISQDKKNVYAISEASGGGINAFDFNASTGALKFLNKVPAQGPAYVSVNRNKTIVLAANYGGGSLTAVRVNADGSLAEDKVQTIQHEGSSVVKQRQDKPHVHSAVWSPDNKYILTPDLGTDKVYQYMPGDANNQILKPQTQAFVAVEAGGGPRHLSFHPNGKWAYLVLELKAAVMVFGYNKGRLKSRQTASMTNVDFKGAVSGADIHVSPDGKFLYASNRGDANEIAIFSIGKKGEIKLLGTQSTLGKTPRNFAIDPSGNFLLVGNQNTDEIVIFKRNKQNGLLTAIEKRIAISKPVCLQFVIPGK
jgi:6-phosphogluconolactonase